MNPVSEAATHAVHTALEPLERRMVAAHDHWVLGRDVEFIERLVPTIERVLRFYAPEVRHVDGVPESGPVLVVGNHSGLYYMPDVWVTALAMLRRRRPDSPAFGLAYDLLFAVPGLESVLRRFGAVPAVGEAAEQVLGAGHAVIVYPGGDWEACRPWTERNRVDFHGRSGFVRLALRAGVPIVPVVAHGSHHSVFVVSRGDRIARALGLDRMRIHVLPWIAGVPFGVAPLLPPVPLPAKVTVDFLEPIDWSTAGPDAAEDPAFVRARYDEVTGVMQAGLDRLTAERPHPVLSRLGLAH
jgi:1-acyl-sn-glycerol-3-phosphate acyltransferase